MFKALVSTRLAFLYYYWVRMVLKATVQKQSSKQSCQFEKVIIPEVHWRTLDSYPIKWLSIRSLILGSIKLVITNMTYTCMENYPPSYQRKQLIKIPSPRFRYYLRNQKHNVRWLLLRWFVGLLIVCSLHIIKRNHSNTFK